MGISLCDYLSNPRIAGAGVSCIRMKAKSFFPASPSLFDETDDLGIGIEDLSVVEDSLYRW